MPDTIHCPSCRRELRVPAELVDKKVKCPGCGVIFTASLEPEAAPQPPVVLPEEASPAESGAPQPSRPAFRESGYEGEAREAYADEFGYPDRRLLRAQSLSPVKAPAIGLMITGLLGLMCNSAELVLISTVDAKQFAALLPLPPEPQRQLEDAYEKSVEYAKSPLGILSCLGFFVIDLILIVGAIAMLRGKAYWLAMTASIVALAGSILALVNLEVCCCLLWIPFGIWSLVVLMNPAVKAAFE